MRGSACGYGQQWGWLPPSGSFIPCGSTEHGLVAVAQCKRLHLIDIRERMSPELQDECVTMLVAHGWLRISGTGELGNIEHISADQMDWIMQAIASDPSSPFARMLKRRFEYTG